MKSKLIVYLFILLSFNSFSQISFKKGYFIKNSGEKINCFIKDFDSKNSPINFEYKLLEDSESQLASIKTIKEYAIINKFKFKRFKISIDKSSDNVKTLTSNKNPNFIDEEVFLNVLIEGKASLFSYSKINLTRFFHLAEGKEIKQLVYKRYLKNNKIAENNQFRQQLSSDLICNDIKIKNFENVNYRKNELIKLYKLYNTCVNSEFTTYQKNKKKAIYNVTIRPGIKNSSLSIINTAFNNPDLSFVFDTNFDRQSSVRFGIELELVLPFYNNKWSLFAEPVYQSFNSEKEITYLKSSVGDKKSVVKIDYSSIEIHFGLRHYLFLNNDSKLFINALLISDIPTSNTIRAKRVEGSPLIDLEIDSDFTFATGIGYKFNDQYSFELRYAPNSDLLGNFVLWDADYDTISFIFGYTIF